MSCASPAEFTGRGPRNGRDSQEAERKGCGTFEDVGSPDLDSRHTARTEIQRMRTSVSGFIFLRVEPNFGKVDSNAIRMQYDVRFSAVLDHGGTTKDLPPPRKLHADLDVEIAQSGDLWKPAQSWMAANTSV